MNEELFKSLKLIFDRSPQAVGVAKIILDDHGNPCDFSYEYLNEKLASMTDSTIEDLVGLHAYREWGNEDMSWLIHFTDAAMNGIPCEFEAVATLLERFEHVTVIPLVEGYCIFIVQDIADFIHQDSYVDDDLSVGLFYLDLNTLKVMLSEGAKDLYGFEKSYIPVSTFYDDLFGKQGAVIAERQIDQLRKGKREILYESRTKDGRWLRITANHVPHSKRFAFCIIRDISRAREAEARSAYRMNVIESLTRENFALYVLDMKNEAVEEYSHSSDLTGIGFVRSLVDGDHEDARAAYLHDIVAPEDRDLVEGTLSRDTLKAFFASDDNEINITYRRMIDDEEKYVEIRLIRLQGKDQTAVLAIRNAHSEIEEQIRQKNALQKALELAQHASAAKSTFLTNMSHDFRTPMNSIVGFTNIALEHTDDKARMVDCLQKIRTSSDHLLRLINDVLDVSRIESGIVESDEDELDLVEFAKSLEAVFSGDAQNKDIEFTIDTSNLHKTKVCADRQHLAQIMVNLIGNAFKFTHSGGKVSVRIAEYKEKQLDYGSHVPVGYGRFEFIVADTGCGMVPEFMDLLFVPFERNGLGRANSTEGTGLGMPITKNLVDLLGGSIEVKSEVGKGSEFTVTLPLRLADTAEEWAADDSSASSGSSSESDPVDMSKEALTERFAGKRILIVDDDDLSREILKEILISVGFVIDEAWNGKAAVDTVLASDEGHYDAIILDMRMPEMSGDEAARVLRESGRDDLQRVPMIALTADAFEEGRRRSKEAGMVAHITKPFKRGELMELLVKFV